MKQTDVDSQLEIIVRGTEEIISLPELRQKLGTGRKLVVKAGFDPTAPDLHLGHVVLLKKMRDFQELGHTVVFLIGDFTGMIGDPSGKNKTRPPLDRSTINKNAKTYEEQVSKILDRKKTRIEFNSKWMDAMGGVDLIRLASHYNVARMLERDDFHARYANQQPIAIHEFLYPLVQAYDSVALKADIELGASDQKFNLLVGRDIQKAFSQEPQVTITVPILEGLRGTDKMSKSLGNYVGINEPPQDIYGKLMSVSDDRLLRYIELLSKMPKTELEAARSQIQTGTLNPMRLKKAFAFEMVEMLYGKADAENASAHFEKTVQKKQLPDEMERRDIPSAALAKPFYQFVQELIPQPSNSETKRLIAQGGVTVNDQKLTDPQKPLASYSNLVKTAEPNTIRVGKRKLLQFRIVN